MFWQVTQTHFYSPDLYLQTEVFIYFLKIAKLTPLLKNGDPKNVGNYRPISALLRFPKMLERVTYKCVHNYFTENKLIYKKQSGFQSSHSTNCAIVQLVDHLKKSNCRSFERCCRPCRTYRSFKKCCKLVTWRCDFHRFL